MRYEKADATDPGHRLHGVDPEEKEKALHDNEDHKEMINMSHEARREGKT